MSQKFCKAQVFSIDFLVATSIFLLVLTVIMIYWSYTNMQIEETKTINEMVDKAYTISQVWFREGTPEYWDSANVRELGLLSNHKINETKMDEMKKLGYGRVKGIIGASPYEFRFLVTKVDDVIKPPIAYINYMPSTELSVLYTLNKSGLDWDFYWARENEIPPINTARNFYNGTEVNMLKKLIANINEYNTIISEKFTPNNPQINSLTNEEKDKFRNFVNTSNHVYLHIWESFGLLKVLNDSLINQGPVGDIVDVKELDPILIGLKVGDKIDFKNPTDTFDIATSPLPLKTIAQTPSGDNCAICRWQYGNGTIYYIVDTCNQTGSGSCPLNINVNPIGYSFVFGKYPTQARNVIKVERSGILNSSIAIIEVLLWR